MHALRAGGEHETVLVGLPFGDRRARLDVVGDEAVVAEFDARDLAGLREGGLGLRPVAVMVGEGAVRAEFRPDQRRIRVERGRGVRRRVAAVVVDLDQVGGILRQGAAVGDDEGDRIADIMHLIPAEDRDVARRRLGPVRLALIDVDLRSRRCARSAPVSTRWTPGAALAASTEVT